MTAKASAPASAANLGPGFDCIALAFELRVTVSASPSDTWLIKSDGAIRHVGPDDLVRRAAEAGCPGPLEVDVVSDIPIARGLGSSAAVAAAAYTASCRLEGREPEPRDVFLYVASLEGHPDNASAAVFGGLTLARGDTVRMLELSERLVPVVAIPGVELMTAEARSVLPETLRLDAVARSVSRMAFLIEGLRTGDRESLARAGGDEIHEAPRAGLSPITGALMRAARHSGALHAGWSGAGPAAIAFAYHDDAETVRRAMERCFVDRGVAGSAQIMPVASEGLR